MNNWPNSYLDNTISRNISTPMLTDRRLVLILAIDYLSNHQASYGMQHLQEQENSNGIKTSNLPVYHVQRSVHLSKASHPQS